MRALIVDDDVSSRKPIEIFMRKLGYDLLTASNGEEAWDIWKREQPQLVVTDWLMPVMDGLTLCRKIRESEQGDYTYIIIVTSKSDNQDIVKGMEAGADDYLAKPIARDELLVRIKAGERVLNLQSKDVVIFSLAKLAEYRDNETGMHLERIRYYCRELAESMDRSGSFGNDVNRHFIDNLFMTCSLHDIGKVGVPDRILLKPGRLDTEEFEIMKTHTVIGFTTLNDALEHSPSAQYLRMATEVARSHHEKFDGSGYPDGTKAKKIPLSARIVAVADVYDALISKRVYKPAFRTEEAIKIIREGKGKHFDPDIVEVFESRLERFAEIQNQYKDE